jgi:hypothetical protein
MYDVPIMNKSHGSAFMVIKWPSAHEEKTEMLPDVFRHRNGFATGTIV